MIFTYLFLKVKKKNVEIVVSICQKVFHNILISLLNKSQELEENFFFPCHPKNFLAFVLWIQVDAVLSTFS